MKVNVEKLKDAAILAALGVEVVGVMVGLFFAVKILLPLIILAQALK